MFYISVLGGEENFSVAGGLSPPQGIRHPLSSFHLIPHKHHRAIFLCSCSDVAYSPTSAVSDSPVLILPPHNLITELHYFSTAGTIECSDVITCWSCIIITGHKHVTVSMHLKSLAESTKLKTLITYLW